MMSVQGNKVDVGTYITKVKMSRKVRILVEGPHDKVYLSNLLDTLKVNARIKVETATNLIGDCPVTRKNNKAKIMKIHEKCKNQSAYSNLYYLCDREFYKFEIGDKIEDLMDEHESDYNLNWTIGHSLENYFLNPEIINVGFSFLAHTQHKKEALTKLSVVLSQALNIVAAITLAAKDAGIKFTYPCSIIKWQNFKFQGDTLQLCVTNTEPLAAKLFSKYDQIKPAVDASDKKAIARICRGHTAIVLLQRVFSACIYNVGQDNDKDTAKSDADNFSSLNEKHISTALSQAWISNISNETNNYPKPLIDSVA
ncbi:hypothetical protein L1285_21010 [Pseudoalteromonas sp. DL2-H2.2]|uniref:hypothetical protein n=1 Tax=Pseudoalteromonas sp. DL2-H2.2 TaxID=2908889 RepID=UPI001F31D1C0|nr:hypothetical protein [Pseudoalteromonas sp. DL2-H2.2]MCF2910792.1 hypothetical protein [Pseudoalteromonas sp. DL2-H2.2]